MSKTRHIIDGLYQASPSSEASGGSGASTIVVWQFKHSKRSKCSMSSRDFPACMAMPQIGQCGETGGEAFQSGHDVMTCRYPRDARRSRVDKSQNIAAVGAALIDFRSG